MKKKITYMAGMILCAAGLSGCMEAPVQSEAQISQAAEYIASMLLAYDTDYTEALVYPPKKDKKEQEDTSGSKTEQTNDGGKEELEDISNPEGGGQSTGEEKNSREQVTLNEIFSNDNFTVKYQKVEKRQKYQEDSTDIILEPLNQNNILLVVYFEITNNTKKAQTMNQLDSGISYLLDLETKTVKPDIGLIMNDLQFINMKIGAEKKQEAVLIFQIPKDIEIDKAHLLVYTDKKTAILDLK